MKKSILIILIIAQFAGSRVAAQQYSITSQYLTNGLVINPAYAGTREALSVNASYRHQWVRIEGAPKFQNLTIHSPVSKKEKVALGFMLNHTSFAITHNTGLNAFYAYKIPVWHGKLSFGLKAGIDITNINYDEVDGVQPEELFEGSSSFALPNFGAGAYYYSDHLFAGLSLPSLLSYRQSEKDEYVIYYDYKLDRLFLTAGALINLSDLIRLKPSFLLRYAVADKAEVDLNATFIFADVLSFGGSYRLAEKAIVALVDLQVTPQLRVGYSFDYQTGHLNNYTSGTHEIALRYEFEFKVSAASPRYF